MKCYVCDADEKWRSLKDLNPVRELLVCNDCGNIAYRVEPDQEKKVLEYYRKEYRPAPSHENLTTTTNKLNYIRVFLTDWLRDKKSLVCGDVGCATGYFVRWLRALGHRATGSEYTVTFRRFAEHYYGIPVREQLPEKWRYDLLSMYHVLEHMVEPDKKLAHYASLLKDGESRIMVATPQWLDVLEEASGTPITDFTHLYHKDHINVFTERSIKRLFAKCHLIVEKEDHIQYGQTYLLRRAADGEAVPMPEAEDPDKVEALIRQSKKAIDLFKEQKFEDALEAWPRFPEAYISLIFSKHMKAPDHQEEWFKKAEENIPDNARMRMAHGVWLYQRGDYKKSLEQFEWLMSRKPSSDVSAHRGYCLSLLGDHKEAMMAFDIAADWHPPRWVEMKDWACREASQVPAWDERAAGDIKQKLYDENVDPTKIEPVDPVMEGAGGNGSEPPAVKAEAPEAVKSAEEALPQK